MGDDVFTLDTSATGPVVCSSCGEEVDPSEHVLALFDDSTQGVMHRGCLAELAATFDPHVWLVEVAPRVVEVLA
jgi:hypothetical protein